MKKSGLITFLVVFVVMAFVGYEFVFTTSGGIERGIINDEVRQYEMCIRNNDLTGAQTHAGTISALCQQVNDEAGYREWKSVADELSNRAVREYLR